MSTQGTGSVIAYGFELQLLTCWGDWARGDIGLWYVSPGIWKKNGLGLTFSEDDLCQADAAVAALPECHKKTLKRWFVARKGLKLDDQRKQTALEAFAESLAGISETS